MPNLESRRLRTTAYGDRCGERGTCEREGGCFCCGLVEWPATSSCTEAGVPRNRRRGVRAPRANTSIRKTAQTPWAERVRSIRAQTSHWGSWDTFVQAVHSIARAQAHLSCRSPPGAMQRLFVPVSTLRCAIYEAWFPLVAEGSSCG